MCDGRFVSNCHPPSALSLAPPTAPSAAAYRCLNPRLALAASCALDIDIAHSRCVDMTIRGDSTVRCSLPSQFTPPPPSSLPPPYRCARRRRFRGVSGHFSRPPLSHSRARLDGAWNRVRCHRRNRARCPPSQRAEDVARGLSQRPPRERKQRRSRSASLLESHLDLALVMVRMRLRMRLRMRRWTRRRRLSSSIS